MKKNFYTPSFFKKYLQCKYIIFNEYNDEKLGLKKKEITKSDDLRFKKGFKHEKEYFKSLKNKYKKIIDIKSLELPRDEKIKKTLESIHEGYEIIYNGHLDDGKWSGEFDFLEINKNLKSNLGNYSYEILDAKNTSKIKPDHVFQLSVYSDLLEKVQGIRPLKSHIILKGMIKNSVSSDSVFDFYKLNKKKYENFIEYGIKDAKSEKCSHCKLCEWQDECKNNWLKNDSLNIIPDIRKDTKKKLIKNNIHTVELLSKQKISKKIEGINPDILQKFILISQLIKKEQKTRIPQYLPKDIDDPNYVGGFKLLPKPSENDLFFDIESVKDYVVDDGLEYLFGIFYEENSTKIFKTLWAHSKKEEKNNLIKFFDFTEKHFTKYPDAKIYHYGPYEITAFTKLVSLHNVCDKNMVSYLREGRFIDLLPIVKQSILTTEGYSIKDLEKYYNFQRTGDVRKAVQSEEYYIEWLETQDQKYLDQIESYNKQDCHSTFELRKWLLSIKPENIPWFEDYYEKTSLKKNYPVSEKKEDPYDKIIRYEKIIHDAEIKDKELKKLIKDILGFYIREDKPGWRRYFERKFLTHDDLIEDTECIAKMRRTGEKVPEKSSYIFKYEYDQQEFKFKVGDSVCIANNSAVGEQYDRAGEILEIDRGKKVIKIKRGKKYGDLPDLLSIGPKGPLTTGNLQASTYRFIDSVIENKKKYNALKDILTKQKTRIKGIKQQEKIIKTHNYTKEIPNIILNLDNSYIYIQGPPGTGKTFQAANAIIELLKNKKKVGVTANSHKVIHNLLNRIETFAKKINLKISGLKMGKKDDANSFFDGEYIKTSKDDRDYMSALNNDDGFIFAGTKYHFSNEYYVMNYSRENGELKKDPQEKLDYLFIDEAGQLSVADLIVLGQTAKNIILIGDQNQLGQPTEGKHPGDSGKSILEFLLGDLETVSEDRGIFLDTTYRMTPSINEFISNNFYDGRLKCDENNKNRKILFKKNSIIQSDGIYYLEMDHEGNSQTSEEESLIVKKLINEFIGLDFIEKDGTKRKLELKDILVITPYNAQTNLILSKVDKDTRVGTIDRFQGQEAPITIISMTSSDTDSMPRNREFFFNKNRLNVAISRSQCVSIILFNPNLLDVYPTTEEQLKLFNNFCKILKFKIH